MKREGSAKWIGSLQHGKGWLTTVSGVLEETPYSFTSRFEEGSGTNPEELIAAAHAGCFSMALSGALAKENFEVKLIDTTATVSLEKVDGNWTIKSSHLEVEAAIPGIDSERFQAIADDAKKNCPVSRLLKADISMNAVLRSEGKKPGASKGVETAANTPEAIP